MLRRKLLLIVFCLLSISTIHAQRLCDALIETALEESTENCVEQDGEIFCYAHDNLASSFFTEEQSTVVRPGVTTGIGTIYTVQGTEIDLEEDEWGIAYIQSKASLDAATADSSVRLLMLGDVFLENATEIDEADTTASALDRIYFSTGGDSDCQEAPNTLVLQGPQNQPVQVTINDVLVEIGSTIALGTTDGQMWVTAVAGQATLYPGEPNEVVIPAEHVSEVDISPLTGDTAAVIDLITGEPILDSNGEPRMRLVPASDFTEPVPLSEDGTSYMSLAYYETVKRIPESLLNYSLSDDCLVSTTSTDVITSVGPGENRGTFAYIEPGSNIRVTGKKVVDGVIWWQLQREDVSPNAATAVLELWVPESSVEEAGDCNSVIDVDAPPIITQEPESQTEETTDTTTPEDVPQTDQTIPAVNPVVSFSLSNGNLAPGECTSANVSVEFTSRAFLSGPGSLGATTVTGPNWSTQICPPSEDGTYTYSIDAYSLDNSIRIQKFASITVSSGT